MDGVIVEQHASKKQGWDWRGKRMKAVLGKEDRFIYLVSTMDWALHIYFSSLTSHDTYYFNLVIMENIKHTEK